MQRSADEVGQGVASEVVVTPTTGGVVEGAQSKQIAVDRREVGITTFTHAQHRHLQTIARIGLLSSNGIERCIQAVLHGRPLLLTFVVVQESVVTGEVINQAGSGDCIATQAAGEVHGLALLE